MSGTESMARHLLYTREYLSNLLGVKREDLDLDFEPDTFGHSANLPEILTQGGVKYYYHCRGHEDHSIFRWKAPSGASVLVFREPDWYLGPITYDMVLDVPSYCDANHTDIVMKVYGVGDHGGGPTRRDIERIREMASWPLMPEIRFGRMRDFFKALEKNIDAYPVVDYELNFVFTGCYTSESRIKMANRVGEDRLYDSEALGTMALTQGADAIYREGYARGWKNILFNQFHDILPGSGVIDTREYAMGTFQEAIAYAGANANRAMKAIGDRINTAAFGTEVELQSTSEGAGVGYNIMKDARVFDMAVGEQFGFSVTSRGTGETRAYIVFNTLQYDRTEIVALTVWDWDYPVEELCMVDAQGNEIPFSILEKDRAYWQHRFHVILFTAKAPAFGYATYFVRRKLLPELLPSMPDPRVHRMEDGEIVLENAYVRAAFDSLSMKLVSFVEKETGRELADAERPGACFRLVEEDDVNGMSAWTTGGYGKIIDINEQENVRITERRMDALRQQISYETSVRDSRIEVSVRLDQDSRVLRFVVMADWHEIGYKGGITPQLQFYLPFGYAARCYRYDVPAGHVERPALGHDVPGILYAAAIPQEGAAAVMLTTDSKYGYRGDGDALLINLLRSSYEPDPYPEFGVHHIEIGVGACGDTKPCTLQREALCFSHALLPYSTSLHTGGLPLEQSLVKVEGCARVISLKPVEDGEGYIVRLGTDSDREEIVKLSLHNGLTGASYVDLMENKTGDAEIHDGYAELILPARSLRTVRIK